MKDFDYYSCSDVGYPKKPKEPKLKSTNPTEQEIQCYLEDKAQYDADKQVYERLRNEYNEVYTARSEEFWNDAREYTCATKFSSSVWDICRSKAYVDGHSGGYQEMLICLEYLIEFAEAVLEKEGEDK